MKSKIALLLIFTSVAVLMGYTVSAYSPHYLPGGTNYLCEDNFMDDGGEYGTIEPFLIKPYTQYTITVPRLYMDEPPSHIYMNFYQNSTYVESDDVVVMDMTYYFDGDEHWYYYTFTTSSETNYMSLLFDNSSEYFPTYDMTGFQLEEGDHFTGYEPYTEGSIIDTSAPYFQNAGTVISYFDEPIDVVEIQSALTAYDAVDGDVTENILLIDDQYTPNIDTLGTYEVTFEVSDTSNNTSQIIVQVTLVDVLKPVFSDLGVILAVFPNTYSPIDILGMLSASDNYDGDISDQIILETDGYSSNSSIVGMYEMEFSVTDSSGNLQTYTQYIEVVDNEGPIISGITSIVIGYDMEVTVDDVLSDLTCTDNYDSNESLEFQLESNDYSANAHALGTYTMVFSVEDSSGNTTFQTVDIEVVDEMGPMVYFDSSIIQTYTDAVMSLPDFSQLLINANELSSDLNYYVTVKYDSYTRNSSTPGVYHLSLNYETENGVSIDKNFEIRVIERPIDFIQLGEEESLEHQSVFSRYKEYFIGGFGAFVLLISNGVWIIVFKRRS